MTFHFCTYFDHNYLPRGLALYQSLRTHCPDFQLWVLCLSRECYEALCRQKLPGIHLIALEDLERDDHELLGAKRNRTLIEYYFTCTPALPLYVLNHNVEVDMVTYLDSDLFFFADPAPVFEEMSDNSIAIIGHRFPEHLRYKERYGIYNVGWLSFRRDERALACLHWWRERCIEWCYDREENGRCADQKYLDDWPSRFPGVVVLQHKGANLAPWNLGNYDVHLREHHILVDEQPLIFFHFHCLKQVARWVYDPDLEAYEVIPSKVVVHRIYAPYIRTCTKVERQTSALLRTSSLPGGIRFEAATQWSQPVSLPRRVVRRARRIRHLCRGILQHKYILAMNGLVL